MLPDCLYLPGKTIKNPRLCTVRYEGGVPFWLLQKLTVIPSVLLCPDLDPQNRDGVTVSPDAKFVVACLNRCKRRHGILHDLRCDSGNVQRNRAGAFCGCGGGVYGFGNRYGGSGGGTVDGNLRNGGISVKTEDDAITSFVKAIAGIDRGAEFLVAGKQYGVYIVGVVPAGIHVDPFSGFRSLLRIGGCELVPQHIAGY